MRSLVLLTMIAMFTVSANADMICGSKNQGVKYFSVVFNEGRAVLSLGNIACQMQPIPYNPRSGKYQGWVRVAALGNSCLDLGKAVVDAPLTFLSLSPEVAKGQEGFAQLGYANLFDPGSGSEMKADLRCFVKN